MNETLIGGRINLRNNYFVFHGPFDPDRENVDDNECALLVEAFGLPATGLGRPAWPLWLRGPRVRDMDQILPGTVVATMRDGFYYNDYSGRSHVAIFHKKSANFMWTVDQWNKRDIHIEQRKFLGRSSMDPECDDRDKDGKVDRNAYDWVSFADEYYVVYSTAAIQPRRYA